MSKKKEQEPQYYASPLNNPMLNYAVYYMTKTEKLLYAAGVLVLGGAAGLVFYGGLFKSDGKATILTYISNVVFFLAVGLAACKFFLPEINNMLLEKRKTALRRQFADMLESLSTALSAGNTMFGAITSARTDLLNQYSESDMIIAELSEIAEGMKNGKTLEQMLESFGVRSANEDIMNFSNVISNCYRMGGNFADVVRHTRKIISDKIMIEDEISTKISSNKLQLNAMCVMPIILVALLKLTSEDFASNLTTLVGVLVTTFAIGIFVGSYFWGKKIIDIG